MNIGLRSPIPVPTMEVSFACVCPARVQSARLPDFANAAMTRARAAPCATPATELTALEVDASRRKCCGTKGMPTEMKSASVCAIVA